MYLYLSQAIHKREDHQQQQQHEKTPFISNKINDTRRQKGTGSDRTEPSLLRVLLLLLLLLLADDMIIIIIMIHREMHDRRLDRLMMMVTEKWKAHYKVCDNYLRG